MAQSRTIGQFIPVVGRDGIVKGFARSILTLHHTAECSRRIELTILEHEVLTIGHSVGEVAQTFLHILVGKLIGSLLVTELVVVLSIEIFIQALVAEGSVVSLIVASRIAHSFVALLRHLVHTPLGIEGDTCTMMTACALGGDDDHTVGTTSTIESSRSRIFKHREGFDVLLVDGRQVARIRRTIHDDERIVARIDGGDTTDADGGSATIGTTRVAIDLHTSHTSLQAFHRISHLELVDIIRLDGCCRTGEAGLLSCTISHHHHLIEVSIVPLHGHVHRARHRGLNALHADVANGDRSSASRQLGEGKITVLVGHGNDTFAHFHGGACHRLPIGVRHVADHLSCRSVLSDSTTGHEQTETEEC